MKIKYSIPMVASTLLVANLACAGHHAAASQLASRIDKLEQQTISLKQQLRQLQARPSPRHHHHHCRHGKMHKRNIGKDAVQFEPHGYPVTTSPYLGVQSRFGGNELLVNVPSIDQDLRMLQYRYQGIDALGKFHELPPEHPFIKLSGKVEGQGLYTRNATGRSSSDIDLATAELNILAAMNSWVTGLITLDYENTAPAAANGRVNNARVYLRKGFVTIGNLMQSPWYATLGQDYVPFGRYASAMVSSPLPMILGRTHVRSVEVGYTTDKTGQNGMTAGVYAYRADNNNSNSSNRIAQGGASLKYSFMVNGIAGDAGIDVISNLANSEGMAATGLATFTGFNQNGTRFVSNVPAVDGYADVTYQHFNVIAEYLSATKRFSATNLTFNGQAAKPAAFHVEAGYSFKLFNKPSSFAIGYDQTKQALALNLPHRRYIAAFNTSLYRDTVQTLEFRHDRLYNNDAASGDGTVVTAPGRFVNAVIAQFGIYF